MIYDYIPTIPIRARAESIAVVPTHRAVGSDPRSNGRSLNQRLGSDRTQITVVVAPERRGVTPTGDVRLALGSTLALHLSSVTSIRS